MRKKTGGLIIFFLLLLGAVFIAITQEGSPNTGEGLVPAPPSSDTASEAGAPGSGQESEAAAEWTPPAPPRWYRSNAGGMALQEIPSRLAALRNEYALVIDYISPAELPPELSPFYDSSFQIEIRALYANSVETRKQWIFRDAAGYSRLAAVFEEPGQSGGQTEGETETPPAGEEPAAQSAAPLPPGEPERPDAEEEPETASAANTDGEAPAEPAPAKPSISGFIEVYNADYQIAQEHLYSPDEGETITEYMYRNKTLVKAEAHRNLADSSEQKIYTDVYRYNRSGSLRAVERLYHENAEAVPVRLAFPNRILDAANDNSFFSEKLPPLSDFFGGSQAAEGWRMVYTTDERGRVLTQSLLNKEDKPVWVITNAWSGERIVSALQIEGEEERLVEYEYDGKGNRILERNIRNGVLERLVRTDGAQETEELYMNGVVILKAVWEDGRKISEERVRPR